MADFAGQSGRHARALQAADDRESVIPRHHIESALRRINLLRLHNIAQFTRASFVAEIVDKKTAKDGQPLYIGQSETEIMAKYQLRPGVNPNSGESVLVDPTGEPAMILVINKDLRESEILKKISLKLDTDRELNKLERQEQAKEIGNIAGPPAIPWMLDVLELPGRDTLLDAIDEANQQTQVFEQLTAIAQKMGVEVPELLQRLSDLGQAAAAPQERLSA